MKRWWMAAALLIPSVPATPGAEAGLMSHEVDYTHGDTELRGYLAYDDSLESPRPGVLVVHEWWGLNDHARRQADEIARLGYVAFAVDMYGKGVVTTDAAEAGRLAGRLYGKPLLRERVRAGFDVLARHPRVDARRIGAIGFCFGGTTVLELAYSGAPVAAVVSFHGGLTAPGPQDLDRIRASILVLHGAEDPLVKPEQIETFLEGVRKAGADWTMVWFGGAVHSFTNPEAGKTGIPGVAYDKRADVRSRRMMEIFFEERLRQASGGKDPIPAGESRGRFIDPIPRATGG